MAEVQLYFQGLHKPTEVISRSTNVPRSPQVERSLDRATLKLNYQTLDSTAAQLLRFLGLLVGDSFTEALAATLIESEAQAAIASLITANFIEVISSKTYQWTQDQVRSFARQQLGLENTIAQRQSARLRICHWYLEQIESISPTSAAWFEAERPNLLAAIEWADQAQSWEMLVRLVEAIAEFLDRCGDQALGKQLSQLALKASRHSENPFHTAALLNNLGNFDLRQQQWQAAVSQYEQSLQISSRLSNSEQAAQTLVNLGILAIQQGQPMAAGLRWKAAIAQLSADAPEQIAIQQRMFSIDPDLLQAAGGTINPEPTRFFQSLTEKIKRFILE